MVFDFFHHLLIAYFPCVLVLYEILLHLLQCNAIGGFLSSYLNRDSASDHVRDAFARFQVGLERGCLQKSELQWAEQMLLALKPLWWEEWEDHRALMSVLLKTQALLRADK